ncbi:hypothetical protein Cni_G18142 [Canna indica]|uniref:Uncharacterized protein n=1 Tax=Canna indica TaxID=4628 RepID=A0AAQ3QFT6_9LILI|nr:hypothetical protein Cni_G18142 [Canna indica]
MCGGAVIFDLIQEAESSRRAKKDGVRPSSEEDRCRKKKKKKKSGRVHMADEFMVTPPEFDDAAEVTAENDVECVRKISEEICGDAIISNCTVAALEPLQLSVNCSGLSNKKRKARKKTSGKRKRMRMDDRFQIESKRQFHDEAKDEIGCYDEEEDEFEVEFQQFNNENDEFGIEVLQQINDEVEDDNDEFEVEFQQFNDEVEDDEFQVEFLQFNDDEEEFDDKEESISSCQAYRFMVEK